MCGPDFSSYLNKKKKQNKKLIKTFKTCLRNGNLNIACIFFIKLLIFLKYYNSTVVMFKE